MATARVERRLAAILAADVVGYSRLMGADEAGTLARLTAIREELVEPLLAEHRGRIVKLMGDGLLCEFASVIDAIACAVAIQRGMAGRERDVPEAERVRFRIGVNLGDIIVEGNDIFGEGVNVAARLERLAEPGGVCVSGKVREELRRRLDLAFAPMGAQRIKNIAEPVEAWRLVLDRRASDAPSRLYVPAQVRAALALLLAAAVGLGTWWWLGRRDSGPPPLDRPSVAVLPFDNLSGAEEAYIADGLTEDLIGDLSQLRGLAVIARTSSQALRGQSLDAREIGRRLNARFLVEGSVRKASDRLRVNARLTDTATGEQRWAERWDRPAADVLTVQDELTRRIVEALDVQLSEGEQAWRWRRQTDDPAAYDLFLRGRARKLEESRDGALAAIPLLTQAVERDPGFAAAWVWLGWAYWAFVYTGWTDRPDDYRQKAIDAARRAIAAEPGFGGPYTLLADIAGVDGKMEEAERYAAKAVELDPGSADNLAFLAGWSRTTQPERAFDLIQRAFRLNPIPPTWYYNALGMTQLELGRHREAAEAFDRCLNRAPEFTSCRQYLIAAQLEAKDLEAAKVTAKDLLHLMPGFSIAEDAYWYKQAPNPAEAQRRFELLRQAGLPE